MDRATLPPTPQRLRASPPAEMFPSLGTRRVPVLLPKLQFSLMDCSCLCGLRWSQTWRLGPPLWSIRAWISCATQPDIAPVFGDLWVTQLSSHVCDKRKIFFLSVLHDPRRVRALGTYGYLCWLLIFHV